MEKPLVSFHGSCLARFFKHVTNALESFRMLFKIKSLERSNLLINLIPSWWWPKISLFCRSYVYANVPTRIFLTNIIIIHLLNWGVVKEKCEKNTILLYWWRNKYNIWWCVSDFMLWESVDHMNIFDFGEKFIYKIIFY